MRSVAMVEYKDAPAPPGREDTILPTGGYLLGSAPLAVPPCLPEDEEKDKSARGESMDSLRRGLVSGISGKKVY